MNDGCHISSGVQTAGTWIYFPGRLANNERLERKGQDPGTELLQGWGVAQSGVRGTRVLERKKGPVGLECHA